MTLQKTCNTFRFLGESEVHMADGDNVTWCDRAIPEKQRSNILRDQPASTLTCEECGDFCNLRRDK
jgi:hypothetical protein